MRGLGKVGLGLLKGKEGRGKGKEGGRDDEGSSLRLGADEAHSVSWGHSSSYRDSSREFNRAVDSKVRAGELKGKGVLGSRTGAAAGASRDGVRPHAASARHVPSAEKPPSKGKVQRERPQIPTAPGQAEPESSSEARLYSPHFSRLNRIHTRSGPLILFAGTNADAKVDRRAKAEEATRLKPGRTVEGHRRFSDGGFRIGRDTAVFESSSCLDAAKPDEKLGRDNMRNVSAPKAGVMESACTQMASDVETLSIKAVKVGHSNRTGDLDSSDNESPMSQSDAPKETESPRFQALLRMTGGKSKPLKDIKSFSHELDPKGIRLGDFWRPHSSNVKEILDALQSRFISLKEEVDSELEVFAGNLVEMLESSEHSQPQLQEGIEDLLVLARRCAVMSHTDFREECEAIVQDLDDRRQELPMGILKQLHTRMLFILTRCTRLLQLQKENALNESGAVRRFHKNFREVPSLDRAWTLQENGKGEAPTFDRTWTIHENVKSSFSDLRRGVAPGGSSDASIITDWPGQAISETSVSKPVQHVRSESVAVRGKRVDSTVSDKVLTWQKSAGSSVSSAASSSSAHQTSSEKVQTFSGESHAERKGKTSSAKPFSKDVEMHASRTSQHHRVAWGYWGDQPNILDDNCPVICRICEDEVPSLCLEEHSRICACADRCDHKSLSVDDRLLRLALILEKSTDFHNTNSVQSGSNGFNENMKLSHSECADWFHDPTGALHERGKHMMEDIQDNGGAEEFEHPFNGQARPRSEQSSTSSTASPLVTPTSVMDLSMCDRIHLADAEDVMQINELADIARCAANANTSDGGVLEYLDSCIQDLEDVLQQSKAAALTVDTFGRRIRRLLRDKYCMVCDALEGSISDAASCEHDPEGQFEDDAFRSTPVHPAYKDRTTKDDFEIIKPISRGAFGRVFLARKRTTGDLFAIKVLRKLHMIRKNAVESVQAERNILISARNPFMVRFFYSFTCKDNLYLVMEYLNGGDLYSMLRNLGCLEEDMARIYIAELVLALEYLHSLGVVHRDLKPDNLLIAHDGHIKLTDFGLSKVGLINSTEDLSGPAASKPKRAEDISGTSSGNSQQKAQRRERSAVGTPDYLAPEILLGTGHGYTVDWWSTGVILFECLVGIPPFNAEHPQIIFDNILNRNIPWPLVPDHMSYEAQDLIDRLLAWDPNQRLGAKGAAEVKAHPFFKHVNWDTLARQKAAFIPSPDTAHDTSYFTSRHVWSASDTHPFSEQDIGDSSEYGSSSGDSSTTVGSGQEEGDECRDLAEFEITPSVKYSFSNFSFKNLSQLASINYDLLLQTGRDSTMKEQ